MCDVDFSPSRPSSRRGRTLRAGRAAPPLLLALVLLLGACDTAQAPDPADPSDPAPEVPAPEEPATPDLSRVEIELEPVAAIDTGGEEVVFERPLGVVTDGSSDALYVMQQGGVVEVIEDGVVRDEPFLDLSDEVVPEGEAGLLGLVFHPDYPETPEVFVHYTPTLDGELTTVVSRMRVSEDGIAQEGEEEILFRTPQPALLHNGGQLAFGPDGMLYVALGEGDPERAPSLARDPSSPHGSILRLDPSAEADDYVPSDNPFADGTEGNPYVWHYGLRNPWRFSFDPATDDLWVADVGEDTTEEINVVGSNDASGLDFGWDRMEGDRCVDPAGCEDLDAAPPVLTYDHPSASDRRSVTGGYVYHGDDVPHLAGAYVFGDYMSGEISAAAPSGEGYAATALLDTEASISSFGLDADGEIVVVDYGDYDWETGARESPAGLYRIVPAASE